MPVGIVGLLSWLLSANRYFGAFQLLGLLENGVQLCNINAGALRGSRLVRLEHVYDALLVASFLLKIVLPIEC
jgi:hypothetical protein